MFTFCIPADKLPFSELPTPSSSLQCRLCKDEQNVWIKGSITLESP